MTTDPKPGLIDVTHALLFFGGWGPLIGGLAIAVVPMFSVLLGVFDQTEIIFSFLGRIAYIPMFTPLVYAFGCIPAVLAGVLFASLPRHLQTRISALTLGVASVLCVSAVFLWFGNPAAQFGWQDAWWFPGGVGWQSAAGGIAAAVLAHILIRREARDQKALQDLLASTAQSVKTTSS